MRHKYADGVNRKVRPDGTCTRCGDAFGERDQCASCGVNYDRRTVSGRRTRSVGGKRGRNSGRVSQHGKKS